MSGALNRYDDQRGLKTAILLSLIGVVIGAILGALHIS